VPRPPRSVFERFWEKVEEDPATGCWLWTASRGRGGYGNFSVGPGRPLGPHQRRSRGRGPGPRLCSVVAHRHAYRQLVGPIPSWLQVHHVCVNPSCVNPEHLELATPRDNTLASNNPTANNARKTHCLRGHPLSGSNLYRFPSGRRGCRTCGRRRGTRTVPVSLQELINAGA